MYGNRAAARGARGCRGNQTRPDSTGLVGRGGVQQGGARGGRFAGVSRIYTVAAARA